MNFHLAVEPDEVRVTATDLDTSVSLRVPCQGASAGRTLVPARLFSDLVKTLPADVVMIESEGETLRVVSRGGDFSLPTADPDDYPQLPRLEQERSVSLGARSFAALVHKVADFVSTEENRPDLNGVLVEFRTGELRMVSTNGHLMAVCGVGGEFGKAESVLVPPSALLHAVHGIAASETISLGIARTQIVFEIGPLTVFSRLLEGAFPRYEQVIPEKNNKVVTVRRDELIQALRRVDVVADNITHQVRFALEAGLLSLQSQQTVGGGRAKVRVEAQYDGEPLEIGFNAKYVMEILKTVDTEEVEVALDTPLSAAIVRPTPAPTEGRHLCLVMPLRLPE
jgi:DNA polymerase-3 subunit beta